jgi:hypothetical protein
LFTDTESERSSFHRLPITALNLKIPQEAFLVYYFLTRDDIRCDREGKFLNGSNEAGMLFRSLREAEAFARSVAELSPRIGSGIYNSSWNVVGRFVHDRFTQQQAKANAPTRLFLWAAALLAVGTLLMWLEVRSGWRLIVGFLIGARLLLRGVVKLATGMYRLRRNVQPP